MFEKKEFSVANELYEKKATVYYEPSVPVRACILYFHGGGLLYGSREDLPMLHIQTLTSSGYAVFAFDYPLAPAAKLDMILKDVCTSINSYSRKLPYFLWGRSAGAYLVLLAAASGCLNQTPAGILSYYGYGLLCDNWFSTPSSYYCSLPPVSKNCLEHIPKDIHAEGALGTHYSVYVYARQTGFWQKLIYEGRDKFFYLNYSLRSCPALPCPLFCAHSLHDPDVPFSEFTELCSRFHATSFIAPRSTHDFDRDETDPITEQLLQTTLHFLNQNIQE